MTLEEAIDHFSYKVHNAPQYLAFDSQILHWLEELKQNREILDRIREYAGELNEKASSLSINSK